MHTFTLKTWRETYLIIIEVVALAETNVEGMVAVLAHQLVKVLANVIHFY